MGTNNGNHGVKGRSGRKGALVELNNAQILHDMFFTDQGKDEIIAKLKTGKYSLKDVFIQKGFAGNDKVLMALFNKNFPDTHMELVHSFKPFENLSAGDKKKIDDLFE